MIERKLLFRLVLPLVIIALFSIALTWPPRLDDLLANLAVEIAGILITVLFVDWILRSREAERWRIADLQIRADFASIALRFLAHATHFLTDAGWKSPEVTKPSPQIMPWSFVLEHITLEEVHSAMSRSKQEEMATFAEGVHECINDLAQQHARFSPRLSPEDTDSILRFEGHLLALKTELDLLKDDSNLMELLEDDADLLKIDGLTRRHVQKASQELHQAMVNSLAVFGRAFSNSR